MEMNEYQAMLLRRGEFDASTLFRPEDVEMSEKLVNYRATEALAAYQKKLAVPVL